MRAAILLLPILLASCVGVAARNNALLPAMQKAYNASSPYKSGIYADIRRGIDARDRTPTARLELRLLADDLGDALKSGDSGRVSRVNWQSLRVFALAGISDRVNKGEIGPGVAVSLMLRVDLFNRSFQLLLP